MKIRTLNTMFQKMFHQEKRYGNSTQSSRIASQYLLGGSFTLVHWNALLSAGPECFSAFGTKHPHAPREPVSSASTYKGGNLEPLDKHYLEFLCDSFSLLPPPTQEQQPTGLALQGPNLLHILAPTRRIARN